MILPELLRRMCCALWGKVDEMLVERGLEIVNMMMVNGLTEI